ncbi:SARP family transcriptional regulator [Acrocarpospora phusangensis]|uniref:SARP family transcriptional regulator n=2 Tax=Acrocarpospora phusangensis TaxID=1070424 RepID=A0A919UP50_9ACTN|nr:SARP family transcriptional regulator [Acrocarpospora phusangensis]
MLLAALVAQPNQPVTPAKLIDILWESPPRSAQANLRLHIHQLRRLLGDRERITRNSIGYVLHLDPGELDVTRFTRLAEAGVGALESGDHARAVDLLTEALELWRGPAYDDLRDARWPGAAHLEEARLRAVELRAQADFALGRYGERIGELTALVEAHPTRERPRAHLMLALYRTGRQAEALEAYQDGRRVLVEELGLEPGAELTGLQAAILRGDPLLNALPQLLPAPAQLPPDIPEFVGRAEELATLNRVLNERLSRGLPAFLGLTGMGGIGKTGLAVHWAHRVAARFAGGQLYADLRGHDPTAEPLPSRQVLDRFLRALGVPGTRMPDDLEERVGLLRSVLAQRRVLMVLDNVVDSDHVRPLLPGASASAVVITSRNQLDGLAIRDGCHVLRLGPLAQDESISLLAQVAGDALRRNDSAVAQVSAGCGGLPLALRIAAARLTPRHGLSAGQLAQRMIDERGRLDELSQGELRVRTSFELTYRALDPAAATLFRRIGALNVPEFAGWTPATLLDSGGQQAGELVTQLLDAQLIENSGVDRTGQPRYRIHDLLRLYARERSLAEDSGRERAAALRRVLSCLLDLAERAHSSLYGGAYAIIHGTAPRWQLPPDTAAALLRDPLAWFAVERSALVQAVSQAAELGLDELAWDLALSCVTLFEAHSHFDDWAATHEAALAAVMRAGNGRGEAALLYSLGSLALYQQKYQEARDLLESALERFGALGDDHGYALALRNLALLHRTNGRATQAAECYERARRMLHDLGDLAAEAHTLTGLAQMAMDRGESAAALDLLQQALDMYSGIANKRGEAQARYRLGEARLKQGDYEEAHQAFSSALPLVRVLGDLIGQAYVLRGLGEAGLAMGRTESAEQDLVEALTAAQRVGEPFAEATAHFALGSLYIQGLDEDQAVNHWSRAMKLFAEIGNRPSQANVLTTMAAFLDKRGDTTGALSLRAQAQRLLSTLESAAYHAQ